MTAPVFFAADLHLLPGDQPEQNRRLELFLSLAEKEQAEVFLLGDVFHCWLERWGNRQAGDHSEILSVFREKTANGLSVSIIPGNRDFTAGSLLENESGIKVLPQNYLFEYSLTPGKIFLTHGDLLCTGDLGYLMMRHFLMGFFGMLLWRYLLPWPIAKKIALHVQNKGRTITNAEPPEHMKVKSDTAENYLKRYSADCIICGHVHFGLVMEVDGKKIYTLPPWPHEGSYLRLDSEGLRFDSLDDEKNKPPSGVSP